MANYLFQTGTCLKSELYGVIKNLLITAGWTNVSSNPTTDFDVFTSTGETNDKKLVIQLRPGNATNVYSIESTDYNVMSFRLINGYTPGAGGTAGIIERPSEVWKLLYIASTATTINKLTQITYRYFVNKNMLVFTVEYPDASGVLPILNFIGLPMDTYCQEPNSRGLIVASTGGVTANTVYISDAVGNMPSDALSSTRLVYCQLSPKNPNADGVYFLSEVFYGNLTEGMRGKVSAIYVIPAQNVQNGDSMVIAGKTYRVILTGVLASNSFPSQAILIQIS